MPQPSFYHTIARLPSALFCSAVMGGNNIGSIYKGVRGRNGGKTWQAYLYRVVDGVKQFIIGTYDSEEQAAKAYDQCVQHVRRVLSNCVHRAASLARSRRRAYYLDTGDASGPNRGPLSPDELRELGGTTLGDFAAAAKAARAAFATGSSSYRGVSWQCVHGLLLAILQKTCSLASLPSTQQTGAEMECKHQ